MNDEVSELLIVPMKRGNLPEGPRGGKEIRAGRENRWRER